ncbi:MAG: hypothetical protein ACLU4J_16385 [Butyricimonas paravirosa]
MYLLFLALPSLLFAQKKALQQEECKLWRTLEEPNLSPDGRWATYRYAYLYDTGNQVQSCIYMMRNGIGQLL